MHILLSWDVCCYVVAAVMSTCLKKKGGVLLVEYIYIGASDLSVR
jgi:hypothetical protein